MSSLLGIATDYSLNCLHNGRALGRLVCKKIFTCV